MLKEIFTDREVLDALSLIGRLGLNIVICLLLFFFVSLYLDKRLNTGSLFLISGSILGIASGVYLNYRYLKRFYEKDRDKH